MVFGPVLDAELATWQASLQSKNNHRLVSHIFDFNYERNMYDRIFWNSEDLIAVRVKLIFDLAAYAAHFRLPWSFLHCAKLVLFRVCYKTGSLRQSNFRILDFKAYVTEIFNRSNFQISSKWHIWRLQAGRVNLNRRLSTSTFRFLTSIWAYDQRFGHDRYQSFVQLLSREYGFSNSLDVFSRLGAACSMTQPSCDWGNIV